MADIIPFIEAALIADPNNKELQQYAKAFGIIK